jgi:glycosyltransferase involved in cell wall biosynthesis
MRLRSSDAAPARLVVSNTSAVLTPFFGARSATPWVVIVREYFSSTLERRAFQAILSSATGLVCVSESVRSQFDTSFLARLPTIVVHSGADLYELHALNRSTETSQAREFRILCVGRILSWKGQNLLLDAVALLPPRIGPLHVRVVGTEFGGEGQLTADLRRKGASLAPHISVEFAGESRRVVDHYAWADAVVVPSLKPEPFGKVVIEGMAAGCAVIASGHGGPAEVIEDGVTGLLFEPGSAQDLAKAITKVVSSPALKRELAAAGRAASHKWSGDAAAARILDFLASLTP